MPSIYSNKMLNRKIFVVIVLLGLILFTSCTKHEKPELLKREHRFTLNYGSFEDELDLFDLSSLGINDSNTCIYMQDGFFYIVNGKSKKIMQFTSYGDLISIFYNPETNPVPSFSTASSKHGTQTSLSYKFNSPSKIIVDSEKKIYVVDQLPQDRQEIDTDNNLLLRDVVLCFSSDGKYIDYLGQRGVGGMPFSYITDLFTTKNNELVVMSLTGSGYSINWFNNDGFLLYSIQIETDDLPNPFNEEIEIFASLTSVIPDYNEKMLHLKIDYYESEIDETSGVQAGISFVDSYIYSLDVESGSYKEPIIIPAYEEIDESSAEKTVSVKPFDLLGVTESDWFFFTTSVNDGYIVQIVQKGGEKIIRKQLFVSDDELVYNDIALSKEGIVSALLANEVEASVVWWRTDEVLNSL